MAQVSSRPLGNMESPDTSFSAAERVATYGTVQHRDPVTNAIVLIPKPSSDPNDPLNWYLYPFTMERTMLTWI
jgi:hypothetical protein